MCPTNDALNLLDVLHFIISIYVWNGLCGNRWKYAWQNMHTDMLLMCTNQRTRKKEFNFIQNFLYVVSIRSIEQKRMAPNKIGKSHIQIACIHARWVCISYIIGECIRNEVAVFKWDWCVMQSHNCSLTRRDMLFLFTICAQTHMHTWRSMHWFDSNQNACNANELDFCS